MSTQGAAFDRVRTWLEQDGRPISTRGNTLRTRCPAHDGDSPDSLSVTQFADSIGVHCFGECDTADVLQAMGFGMRDLYDQPQTSYQYSNSSNDLVRTVTRQYRQDGKKTFKQQVHDKSQNVLFRLPQVTAAVSAGQPVYLVEGEADVIALESIGVTATTAAQGASNVTKADLSPLHGAQVIAVVDNDEAGEKWAGRVFDALDGKASELRFMVAAEGKDARDHITAGYGLADFVPTAPPGDPRPRLWRATALAPAQQTSWLARGRIPYSAVTILVGDEGIGKSLFWVWIVAAITTGRGLAEYGIPARTPGKVVLVLTEDEWAFTVRPRLDVAGADLSNVLVIATESDGSGSPMFPRDMHLVRQAEAELVIVDAFLDTVDGRLSMKDPQQARQALHPWKEAATVTGSSVLLLTHTNRVDSKSARDRYGITGELRKKARMTLYAQQDEEGQLTIGPEKSNITGQHPAATFTIEGVQHFKPTEDDDGTVARLHYLGDSNLTAREHLEANHAAAHGEDEEDRNAAQEFVLNYIDNQPDGEAKAGDVIKAGRAAGFSENDIKNARKRSKRPKIKSTTSGIGNGWVWRVEPEDFDPLQGVTQEVKGVASLTRDPFDTLVTPCEPNSEPTEPTEPTVTTTATTPKPKERPSTADDIAHLKTLEPTPKSTQEIRDKTGWNVQRSGLAAQALATTGRTS